MFATIFVAADGRSHGRDAMRLARCLAAPDTRIIVESLDSPTDAVAAARRERADLVVAGADSGAVRLLDGSPIAVAVSPRGYSDVPEDRLRVIGVGFDGQPESHTALRVAERLALEQGATMRVYAVAPRNTWAEGHADMTPQEYRHLVQESLPERLRDAVESLHSSVRAASSVIEGDPVEVLAARSGEGLDLLVVGSRGYGPVRRVVFGSVSARLIGRVECPLLVVPRAVPASDAPDGLLAEVQGSR